MKYLPVFLILILFSCERAPVAYEQWGNHSIPMDSANARRARGEWPPCVDPGGYYTQSNGKMVWIPKNPRFPYSPYK